MKTRLLKKLRREASEHFKFKIVCNSYDTYAFVESRGEIVAAILTGDFNTSRKELAEIYCRNHIREYILGKVKILKAIYYY